MRALRRAGLIAALVASLAMLAPGAHATEADREALLEANQKNAAAPRWCRVGAFIDALKLMNSILSARDALGKDAAPRVMAELGGMLAIAIRQAGDEYPCVEGTLITGYHAIYATTVKRAATVAQALRLPPDAIATAHELAAKIEATGAPK